MVEILNGIRNTLKKIPLPPLAIAVLGSAVLACSLGSLEGPNDRKSIPNQIVPWHLCSGSYYEGGIVESYALTPFGGFHVECRKATQEEINLYGSQRK